MKIYERDVQAACLEYLILHSIPCWRQNSGMMTISRRFIRFLTWKWPRSTKVKPLKFLDIAGFLPDGKYFTIEIKVPGEEPNKGQQNTIDMIVNRGGVAFWADSVDMMVEKFKQFGYKI
jgi:hypothetical protein